MCDLICDVITYCVRSCDMGKSMYMIKRENMEIKEIYMNFCPKDRLPMEFTTC